MGMLAKLDHIEDCANREYLLGEQTQEEMLGGTEERVM